MPASTPGTAVSTDPRAAWYAWRSKSSQRDDCLANYEFGLKVGQRVAIERTSSWAGLVPLLQDVLDYLIETAIERAADMGDRFLTGVDGNGEENRPSSAAPDLTVEPDAQQRSKP